MVTLVSKKHLLKFRSTLATKKILITESSDSLLVDGLTALGYECRYDPGISQSMVHQIIQEFTGLIVATRIVVNKELLDAAGQLRFVARAGSGMENIDTEYARSKNVVCINSPEGNSNSVGEHALGLLLAFFHNITKSNAELQQSKWLVEENRVHELEGRTVGIIGYGNTGKSFAKKISSMGMNVLAYDKYLRVFSDQYARETTMKHLFDEAEIISLHLPLTLETLHLVDKDFLLQFSRKIFLINTSRGKIVNHAALLSFITGNKMQGAGLDVYENEKFETHTIQEQQVFHGLINTGRVIFTPHIAGKSYESKGKISTVLIDKIKAIT